jgi:hypothetical protein
LNIQSAGNRIYSGAPVAGSPGPLRDAGRQHAEPAIAVPNTFALFPGSKESGTTVITLLFTAGDVTFADQVAAAQQFVAKHFDAGDHVIGITGTVPARVEQGRLVQSSLPVLDLVTITAVLLIVAFAFRSLVAPLLTLAVATAGATAAAGTGALIVARWRLWPGRRRTGPSSAPRDPPRAGHSA